MIERKKIISLLEILEKSIQLAENTIEDTKDFAAVANQIFNVQKLINKELFFSTNFSALSNDFKGNEAPAEYLNRVFRWFEYVIETMDLADIKKTYLDSEFVALFRYISYSGKESLVSDIKANFLEIDTNTREIISDYYNSTEYFWGAIDADSDKWDLIYDRVNVLKDNEQAFIDFYERLHDYRSKVVLFQTLKNWLTFLQDDLRYMKEMSFPDYFDLDILKCDEDEVFVDCGAYIGDSAAGFIESFKSYKKIYCYEATASTFDKLKSNLEMYENIVYKNMAVGESNGTITLSDDEDKSSIFGNAGQKVPLVTIDSDITEPISILKMDIEGSEQAALKGAKNHIINDHPKLLICVYHGNHDIIEIPILIQSIRDDYNYYLRYNGNFIAPTEIVLFAIPKKQEEKDEK